MTTKEYLSQAYRIDQRIQSKLQQLDSLNDLATKCTSTLSDMPKSPNQGGSTMASTIDKIIDLQNEINADIDRLVDIKQNIFTAIKTIENPEQQTLLEKRYLCFERWESIAVDLGYSIENVYKLHRAALKKIVFPGAGVQ